MNLASQQELERLQQIELQGLELEKKRLEVDELKWRRRWKWGLVAAWTPVILAAIAVVGGWLTSHFNKEREELSKIREAYDREQRFANAVIQIGENGGQVIVSANTGGVFHDITFMPGTYRGTNLYDHGVSRENIDIKRETVKAIAAINPINTLDLSFSSVKDNHLQLLKGDSVIRELQLGGTEITDIGISFVAEIETIEVLGLQGTEMTEAGLAHLAKLPALRELSIVNTNVFDSEKAAKQLKRFPSLQKLTVGQNRYDFDSKWKPDESAIESFKKALPNTEIEVVGVHARAE